MTRLTTAFMMFYVAIKFQVDQLAVASIFILVYNFSELLIENGIFESYVRNYRVKDRLVVRTLSFSLIIFISVLLCISWLVTGRNFFVWIIFPIFILAFNLPCLIYLRYRQKLSLIAKLYFKANSLMLITFFMIVYFLEDYRVVVIAMLVQQVYIMSVLKSYKTNDFNFDFLRDSVIFFSKSFFSFYFKLTTFLSSRFIEIFILMVYGKYYLSSYVAGSRLYNIICLFIFAVVNEVLLKRFKSNLGSVNEDYGFHKALKVVGFCFCPFFVLFFFYSEYIVENVFESKFEYAVDILRMFCIFGISQLLYIVVHQNSLLYLNAYASKLYNSIYLIVTLVFFLIVYIWGVSFYWVVFSFVVVQVFMSILYMLWFFVFYNKAVAFFWVSSSMVFNVFVFVFLYYLKF